MGGFVLTIAVICIFGCEKQSFALGRPQAEIEKRAKMSIKKESFGQTPDGKQVDLYTLTNTNGLKAKIMTYGGILVSLEVPDRGGKLGDVVLGYDKLDDYVKNNPYFGCIVGRYGNRIANGKFKLDGVDYQLTLNENDITHLHGGIRGFDKVVWNAQEVKTKDAVGVKLTHLSKDGDQGYPGNLSCTVTYSLTNNDELRIDYEATTDKATPINLTNHTYFNLTAGKRDILGHELMIDADRFTPVDDKLIPTGELKSVKDSPMDFTKPAPIGSRIAQVPGKDPGGYDHNYVLNSGGGKMALALRISDPDSGRVMEIHTTEPGIQFYSGNFLDGSISGKAGTVYKKHYGVCLETQHFPDSPNKPNFPSTILNPGKKYTYVAVHKFYTR
ncbi:Aldose 1-epimerase [subsurface metagenome]